MTILGKERTSTPLIRMRALFLGDAYFIPAAAGEEGRWIKSDWERKFLRKGRLLVLRQAPATAFIRQLFDVEELAVLTTYHWGEETTTTATFDVRDLDVALASDRGL